MKRYQHILLWLVTLALCGGIAIGNSFLVPPDWNVLLVDATGTSVISGGSVKVVGGTGASSNQVQGTAADGAAAVGNPVQTGGVDGSGNAQAFIVDTSGRQQVVGAVAVGAPPTGINPLVLGVQNASTANMAVMLSRDSGGDAVSSSDQRIEVDAANRLFNSTGSNGTLDRVRNNTDDTLLTSAARTTTQTVTFTAWNQKFLRAVLDMTNIAAGPSVTLTIDGLDNVSGKWVNILTGLAVTTVSTNTYKIGVGLTPVANAVVNDMLVRNMRAVVTANNANSGTYSLGLQLSN